MRAVVYEAFNQRPEIQTLADPAPARHGAVIKVEASGVCRSDWHAWCGHDPVITLPHVPGHELAGTVEAIGTEVTNWQVGARVTVPFVGGCGTCPQCHAGQQQVCDDQSQPGFTHWGSFAEYVAVDHADLNLVALPDDMTFTSAAALGCRFITAFRAVVDQGQIKPGQWVAVHGCGGVGLSAIMIASALGGRPVAVDINAACLKQAHDLGAVHLVDATQTADVAGEIRALTGGGVALSIDALGIPETCTNSVRSLCKRGRHVQVGWMLGDSSAPPIPMDLVMGWELEIVGSHGMQAHRYDEMLAMIVNGQLAPEKLVHKEISLHQSIDALADFEDYNQGGMTIISQFN